MEHSTSREDCPKISVRGFFKLYSSNAKGSKGRFLPLVWQTTRHGGLAFGAQEDAVSDFKQNTSRKLAAIQCPDHRQTPRLQFHGATLRDIPIQTSGCCGKLIEMANKAIAERSETSARSPWSK